MLWIAKQKLYLNTLTKQGVKCFKIEIVKKLKKKRKRLGKARFQFDYYVGLPHSKNKLT